MSQVSEVLCRIVRYKLNFLEIPQNCDFLFLEYMVPALFHWTLSWFLMIKPF